MFVLNQEAFLLGYENFKKNKIRDHPYTEQIDLDEYLAGLECAYQEEKHGRPY